MPDIPAPKIIRAKRRTVALQILPDATLLVKAPTRMSDRDIQQFIIMHTDWIEKRLRTIQQTVNTGDKKKGRQYWYNGTLHDLVFHTGTRIVVKDNKLYFPKVLQFRLGKELEAWYIKEAREKITRQVKRYSQEMQVSYKSLSFSDTKSRWGSCTHDNHLQFNWRLVMAPLLVMNYVIVHELAHITQKNHSMDFWRLVGKYNPSYRQNRKWLKDFGNALFV